MGDLKFTDNAETLLTTAINNTDDPATFSITGGDGANFPTLTGNNWFPFVVVDASGNYEKMRVTSRSTDSLTATRAQGGTTKIAFSVGDACYLTPTAEFFNEYLQKSDIQDGAPNWCGTAGGSANAITLTGDPTVLAYATGQLLSFKALATNTTAVTVDVDGLGTKAVVSLAGSVLAGNEILINGHYFIQYDGTDYHLLNAGGSSFTTLTITTALIMTGATIDTFPAPATQNMLFNEATAPTLWTIDTSVNDKVVMFSDGSPVAGGDWTFSGVTVGGHALTAAESVLISHTHMAGTAKALSDGASFFCRENTVGNIATGTPSVAETNGNAHTHPSLVHNDWRPAFQEIIAATKDA